jgi:hypothetical protein
MKYSPYADAPLPNAIKAITRQVILRTGQLSAIFREHCDESCDADPQYSRLWSGGGVRVPGNSKVLLGARASTIETISFARARRDSERYPFAYFDDQTSVMKGKRKGSRETPYQKKVLASV